MKIKAILLSLLVALAACAPAETPQDEVAAVGTEPAPDARHSLMKADEAWSETVNDAETFKSHLASDVVFLPPDTPRIQGPEAFRTSLDSILALPGAQLRWSPDSAEVSRSGDLGYTIGSFELTLDGPDGEPVSRVGKYVTVWQRQEDGSWKVRADTFNFDAPIPDTEG